MTPRGSGIARPAGSGDLALEVIGVHKHFAGTPALVDASLRVRQGTVHALLGGNGSGKSTLIKCVAGVYTAEQGQVRVLGRTFALAEMTSKRAHQAGLRIVHQDLGLFERMTVAENFAFDSGFPRNRAGGIDWAELRRSVGQLLEQYEIPATPDTPVLALRPAAKTMVAVARALQDQQGSEYVLMLDEPTASLPDHESRTLMHYLRQRAELGQTIVLVSHRMREVLDTADDFTVFRDGRVAGTVAGERPSEEHLVELIAGRAVDLGGSGRPTTGAAPLLEVKDLSAGRLRDLDLIVHRGEIVGVAGLLGSGRSTLLSAVFGLHPPDSGTVHVDGKALQGHTVADAMAAHVALVPQDRLQDAAFPSMTVRQNASASVLRRYWRAWMRTAAERRDTSDLVRRFAVKASGPEAPFMSLSGGNQQKVILARWMRRDPLVLLLDEPTQGVDVVSRSEIYSAVRAFVREGRGVLLASSDFAELCQVCDRVVVLRDGRIAASVPTADLTIDRLTSLVQAADTLEGTST